MDPQAIPDSKITASEILQHLAQQVGDAETITIHRIVDLFGVRGFGLLLLVLALLNIVIFMVPGISLLFGVPMTILSVQMVMGYKAPAIPAFLGRRTVHRESLDRGLEAAIRWLLVIERYIKPRFLYISGPHGDRLHALVCLLLSIMVALPIPLVNVPPSFGIVLIALGMLQRDGVFIIAGYTVAALCGLLFSKLGLIAGYVTG
jgi:hypothetical protein